MSYKQGLQLVEQSLDDGKLSRAERQVLKELIAEPTFDEHKHNLIYQAIFDRVGRRIPDSRDRRLIEWLQDLNR